MQRNSSVFKPEVFSGASENRKHTTLRGFLGLLLACQVACGGPLPLAKDTHVDTAVGHPLLPDRVRTEEGRKIREAFVPESGNILLAADYSQIELRIMAHLSDDAGLLDAFNHGVDVHSATAADGCRLPGDL